jgi:hypothetical protein
MWDVVEKQSFVLNVLMSVKTKIFFLVVVSRE